MDNSVNSAIASATRYFNQMDLMERVERVQDQILFDLEENDPTDTRRNTLLKRLTKIEDYSVKLWGTILV